MSSLDLVSLHLVWDTPEGRRKRDEGYRRCQKAEKEVRKVSLKCGFIVRKICFWELSVCVYLNSQRKLQSALKIIIWENQNLEIYKLMFSLC